MVENILGRFHQIDILVNSAGINIWSDAEHVTEDDWDKILDTNLKGVFFCCQTVGRVMIKQKYGKIVNIGSLQAEQGLPLRSAYIASKGGIKQISKALAIEWAKYNININVVAPAFVRTPMVEKILEDKIWRDVVMYNTPLRRVCEPEEVAYAVLFLVSDAANYITGHTLILDGGWTAGFALEQM
jgi:2-deoxy-D-gluconate 3-dehydrogenase